VARGPSWFQNGSPEYDQLLHNLWDLSPYVPSWSLGQHFLGGNAWERHPVATLMAAALPSHLTFFSDLRRLPDAVIDEARPWLDLYKRRRRLFTQLTYPLLADPLEQGWTALQSWNPRQGVGALLAFRQQDERGSVSIPLRNVPPGEEFELLRGPDEEPAGQVTSQELSEGLTVELPQKDTAEVLLIRRVGG
jgi:hypothetical protein